MNFNGRLARIERGLAATSYSPPIFKGYIGISPCEWDEPLADDWEIHHHPDKGYSCFRTDEIYRQWCIDIGDDPDQGITIEYVDNWRPANLNDRSEYDHQDN